MIKIKCVETVETTHDRLSRTLELEAANFVEELHCVAVHPAAGLLLLGFQDKLRLYAVLEDELRCGNSRRSTRENLRQSHAQKRSRRRCSCKTAAVVAFT